MRRAPKIPLPLFQPSQAKNSSKYKVNEKDIQWKEDIKGPFGHRRKKLSSNANGFQTITSYKFLNTTLRK